MKQLRIWNATLFAVGLIAVNVGPASAATTPTWGHYGQYYNLAGQYSGSVTDSSLGSGTAVANLASSGFSLGGVLAFTFSSATYNNPTSTQSSWQGVRGVFVSVIASSACTFAYTASYSSSSYQLNGSYKAISGCSGESGTFTLTQSCYYDEFSRGYDRDARKPGGLSACT